MTPAHELLRIRYLVTFVAANPERPLPSLSYEHGWWRCAGVPRRLRTQQLELMCAVLEERVGGRKP